MQNSSNIKLNGEINRSVYSINTIVIYDHLVESLHELITYKIDPSPKVYNHSAFVLDVSQIKDLSLLDFDKIKQCFAEHNLFFVGVSGLSEDCQIEYIKSQGVAVVNSNKFAKIRQENVEPTVIVKTLKLEVPIEKKIPYEVKVPYEVVKNNPIKVINRNIRSGETISGLDNSIMIFGSVNSGARIIASHNIIIFGDVKGAQLYAGNPKNQEDPGFKDALICVSGSFEPNFIAIAGNYQTAEDIENDPFAGPVANENKGLVISLKGTSLHYDTLHNFSNL